MKIVRVELKNAKKGQALRKKAFFLYQPEILLRDHNKRKYIEFELPVIPIYFF